MKIVGIFVGMALLANAQSSLDNLIDRFYQEYFRYSPSEGTAVGFHQYDPFLEDYSKPSLDQMREMLKRYLLKFEEAPASVNRDLVAAKIRAQLLAIETTRFWATNPDFYSSGATQSIFSLISRKFAAPETRLRSVIAREKQIPSMLRTARTNLDNPPRIFTEVALEQLPGIAGFFVSDVPKAFTNVTDQALLREFRGTNQAVVDALRDYESFLKSEVLPKSHGDFRIGAETYRKKLLYEEDVNLPLDKLLAIGYENLHQNQQQIARVAKQIDLNKTVEQIAAELGSEHPAADQLLQSFRDTFASLKAFINARHIIGIPSRVEPILEETPPFMRALTTASMDSPGPYETKATEAYFNVTLPEKSWAPKETREFMTAFSHGTIVSTAIHEAYPGHYTQLLWFQQVKEKARKLNQSASNVEGWAHYTEQMMLDEGYGDNDPKLRFGQLIDALLRDCRYIAGIEMHTGKMKYPQGIEFFMKQGYMARAYAEREAKRGTSDPTYLVYTLGKLQIMKLREDYRQKVGAAFNLEQFHNEFVKQGGIPVAIIRRAMLGNDSPSL